MDRHFRARDGPIRVGWDVPFLFPPITPNYPSFPLLIFLIFTGLTDRFFCANLQYRSTFDKTEEIPR